MTGRVSQQGAELVIPSGLVIDDVAIDRLRAQLDLQPLTVDATVAPIAEAPPGSSFRTVAQRASLQPTSVAFVTEEPLEGAALVRDGIEFDVVGRSVHVRGHNVLVDPGASSYDTAAPTTPPFDLADATGRSPFRRAPLVLFVGLEPEAGRAVWARDLVNQLFDHGTEARLATVSKSDPPHLTRPCRPDRATVRALQPDVIVTLDDTVLDTVSAWCDRRSTVVVHHTGERTLTTELVSWRLGASSGRLRAFIGSAVDAPTLASLCSRLCSGPFPAPPTVVGEDEGEAPARVRVRVRRPALQVALVHGPNEPSARLTGFLSEAKAQGAVTHTFGPNAAMDASDHDVVICAHDVDESVGRDLVDSRARRGLKAIVDVVDAGTSTTLAEHCGRAITPTLDIQQALQARDVTVRVLPTLLTRSRLDELQRARLVAEDLEDDEPPVLGLIVDTDATERVSALMAAVAVVLDADEALTVEMLGAGTWPTELRSHPRAATIAVDARPTLTKWRAQAWVGSAPQVARIGRPRPLIEAGYLGIPTVFPRDCRGDVDDELVGRWALSAPQDVDQWINGLTACLGGAVDSAQLARRSDLLFGAKAGMSIVNRILGWASVAESAR